MARSVTVLSTARHPLLPLLRLIPLDPAVRLASYPLAPSPLPRLLPHQARLPPVVKDKSAREQMTHVIPMVKTRGAPAGDPSYGAGVANGHKAKGSAKPRAAPSTASAVVGPSTTPLPGPSTAVPGPPLSLPPQPAFAFHYPCSPYPAQYPPYPLRIYSKLTTLLTHPTLLIPRY
ncbi:hypothetical protein FB45DRAFT_1113656 [Roridomyces roridus]|uniref:Uncharacterized protein n=1 Tax=Roridomyces roridus TaxID=1738132 RepID=A0AAD7CAE5_9AGAR|nr:hypothetical protein FB45DRAFT_1113656 [Roridomyces roridus]